MLKTCIYKSVILQSITKVMTKCSANSRNLRNKLPEDLGNQSQSSIIKHPQTTTLSCKSKKKINIALICFFYLAAQLLKIYR